ncbi:hypothetical protein [Streptomyces sp. NBC_00094]|uniref:hypothetical protein n=1 Tax=Streptomyces sp. NBC_00094 TaxID=2903620 RepID=UPI00224D160D|nr:hypothetical protein [Streptomyces sp. NBC_00094]MCX5394460.1 hypothetical protein [Streptomyces sp. NBC_00094]
MSTGTDAGAGMDTDMGTATGMGTATATAKGTATHTRKGPERGRGVLEGAFALLDALRRNGDEAGVTELAGAETQWRSLEGSGGVYTIAYRVIDI